MFMYTNVVRDNNGNYSLAGIDIDGNMVEHSRSDHPYSYDGYVTYRNGKNEEITGEFYTDRITKWENNKITAIWEKYTEGRREYFHDLSRPNVKLWETVLKEYFDAPNLKIIVMMDYCNWSSGYETGRVCYNKGI